MSKPSKQQDPAFIEYFDLKEEDDTSSQFSASITLTPDQERAVSTIMEWIKNPNGKPMRLGGYAGCGKTTTTGELARRLQGHMRIAYCAYTGKASSVLRRSLRAKGVDPYYCGTIHKLVYQTIPDPTDEDKVIFVPKPFLGEDRNEVDLVIVDEASMVSQDIWTQLLSYGVPVLAVGDHGQLPPVEGRSVQGLEPFSLMDDPDVRLEEVLRQAYDNPIVHLATLIRQRQDWKSFVKKSTDPRLSYFSKFRVPFLVADLFRGAIERPISEDPMILCGTNRTRSSLNRVARSVLPGEGEPTLIDQERVICLRNKLVKDALIANGFRGKASPNFGMNKPGVLGIEVDFTEEGFALRQAKALRQQFGADKTISFGPDFQKPDDHVMQFDYGYALTVHKAQGSQSDKVILVTERFGQQSEDDYVRWLYTGVTRASKELVVAF